MPENNEMKSDISLGVQITPEDYSALSALYDKNKDGSLSKEELKSMIHDYNSNKIVDPKIKDILAKYDTNGDGKIADGEVEDLEHSISLQESQFRYAAYSLGLSRLFRYLAFTSDFGEALRPVVSARIVSGSYAVAFAYCIADVGWEAYKVNDVKSNPKSSYRHGIDGKKYTNMTVTQCIVERSTFQAFASLALPALIIHQTVHGAKIAFNKLNKFKKWGPSVVGLSVIPLLPTYLDEPVEHAIEYAFHNWGPWAKKTHND